MDTVKYVPDAKNTTEFNRLDRECSNIGHLEDVCTDAERSVMRNFFNHAPDSGLYSFLVHKNSYVCSVSSYLAKDGSRALKFCFRTYYSVVFASGLREQGNRDDKYDTEIVLYQDGGIYIKRKINNMHQMPAKITDIEDLYRSCGKFKDIIERILLFLSQFSYIYIDVLSDFKAGYNFPAGMTLNELAEFRTKKEYFTHRYPKIPSSVFSNSFSFVKNYLLPYVLSKVVHQDEAGIINTSPAEFSDAMRRALPFKNINRRMTPQLTAKYFIAFRIFCSCGNDGKKFSDFDESTVLILDYVRMKTASGKKISMRKRSIKKIKEEHDRLAMKAAASNIPDLKLAKCYQLLAEQLAGYELISSSARLAAEAVMQHNCVASYATKINSGSCAIFSFVRKGTRYTAEICYLREEKTFSVRQLLGPCNQSAPDTIKIELQDALEAVSS